MIVDASITVSNFPQKGTPTYVVEDRKKRVKSKLVKEQQGQKKRLNQG
ncbi:MAG: hypothetical protein ACMUEL_05435 [Flavobacteriales bacterium Tduv]